MHGEEASTQTGGHPLLMLVQEQPETLLVSLASPSATEILFKVAFSYLTQFSDSLPQKGMNL